MWCVWEGEGLYAWNGVAGGNDECVQHLHVPDDVWVPVESTVANYVPICDL